MITKPAKLNRTLRLDKEEIEKYSAGLVKLTKPVKIKSLVNKVVNQDIFEVIGLLPDNFVDLLFIDPPYNITKKFNGSLFKEMDTGRL